MHQENSAAGAAEVIIPAPRILSGHTGQVHACAITPDGQRVVSVSGDATLKIWNLKSGVCVRTLRGHANGILACAITQDGQQVVSGSWDKMLKVWDLSSGVCVQTFNNENPITACVFTADGQRVIFAEDIVPRPSSLTRPKSTLQLWNRFRQSGEWNRWLYNYPFLYQIQTCTVTSDGKWMVTANDEKLMVWKLRSNSCSSDYEILIGHTNTVIACAVTPDDERVVSASDDKTLKVWNLKSGVCERTLGDKGSGHTDRVTACAVTSDGRYVVSGSDDKTLKIWDIATGDCRATLSGHTGYVNACTVTPNGQQVVSASSDNTLRLWDISALLKFGVPTAVHAPAPPVPVQTVQPILPVPVPIRPITPPPPIAVIPPPLPVQPIARPVPTQPTPSAPIVITPASTPIQPVLPPISITPSATTPSVTPNDYQLKKSQRDDIVQRWRNGTPIATLLTERDRDNNTPLHRAAMRKQLNLCARLLLLDKSQRITMELRNQLNRTPFYYLSKRQQDKVTSLKTHLIQTVASLHTHPVNILTEIQCITFQNAEPDLESIKHGITQLYQYNELKPLLELAKLGRLGLHDLSKRTSLPNDTGYDSDGEDENAINSNQKLSITIDPNSDTVDGISYWGSNGQAGIDAVGVYTHSNILFIGGDRGSEQARRGTFIHELTHFVADEIYKNSCKPFRADDGTNKRKFQVITEELRNRTASLDPLLARAFSKDYTDNDQNDSELIVRVPQVLVYYGYATGLSQLQAEAPNLLNYYQTVFLPAVERHIEMLKLRTLGGWPLEIFTQGFSRSPGQFEMRSPIGGASSHGIVQPEPATFHRNPFFHIHLYLVNKHREKPATIEGRIADFIQVLQSVTTTRGLTGHLDHARSFHRSHPFANNRNRYHHLRRVLLTLTNTELLRAFKEYRNYLSGNFKLSKLPRNDVHLAEMLRQRIAEGIIPNTAWSEA